MTWILPMPNQGQIKERSWWNSTTLLVPHSNHFQFIRKSWSKIQSVNHGMKQAPSLVFGLKEDPMTYFWTLEKLSLGTEPFFVQSMVLDNTIYLTQKSLQKNNTNFVDQLESPKRKLMSKPSAPRGRTCRSYLKNFLLHNDLQSLVTFTPQLFILCNKLTAHINKGLHGVCRASLYGAFWTWQ